MDSTEGKYSSEEISTEEVIRTVKTMLLHSISLDNSEGFTMALEALEELNIGLNWSAFSEPLLPGRGEWNTPLTLSSKLGRTSMVSSLLQKGANPDLCSDSGVERSTRRTPLHEASKSGHLQVIDCLLTHGCNVNSLDARGWTPIHDAICHDRMDIALKLLENGADPRKSFFVASSDLKNLDLIGRGSLMFSTKPYTLESSIPASFEWNCLSFAANCHQPWLVAKLIDEYLQDAVECHSSSRRTALHEAVKLPESLNLDKEAVVRNRHETMKILLDAGVNPNIPDHLGKNALHLFFDHVNLAKVIVKKYSKIVLETILLLHEYGIRLDMADHKGRTVLHQAAAFGLEETAQILLNLGADIHRVDSDRNTPAHVAAYHGNFEVLSCLMNPHVSHAELINRHGNTLLHCAIMPKADEDALIRVAQTLISEQGFYKTRVNADGASEYDLAVMFQFNALARLLIDQSDGVMVANSDDQSDTTEVRRHERVTGNETDTPEMKKEENTVDGEGVRDCDRHFELGNETDFDDNCDDSEIPELRIDANTNVNEYLMNLCQEYRVRGFHLEDEGTCHERCKIAKQTVDFVEDLLKLGAEDDGRFTCEILRTGSAFEGYRIGKPDEFDYMCELKSLTEEKCEILVTSDPGFVRVRVKEDYRDEWRMFLSEGGFLDASKIKSFMVENLYMKSGSKAFARKRWNLSFNTTSYDLCMLCQPVIATSKAGLKMTLLWQGNVYKFMPIDIDITPAIGFPGWPKSAKVPPSHVLRGCDEVGYHIVPKSEGGDSLLWRLSFSVAELQILQNTTTIQAACYTALKIIKGQTSLRSVRSQSFSHFGYLHTYVLKMKFFEELERCQDPEMWQEGKLVERICSVLESTALLLSQKRPSQVESYFLPGHRVLRQADKHFGNFVAVSIKTTLRKVIRMLRKEPETPAENSPDDTGFIMQFDPDSGSESDSESGAIINDPGTVANNIAASLLSSIYKSK
ncbi:uncharacterized protein LOC111336267 [Stylophora pistillata]|uniref:Ankyrin-3 n=1 Tax=Stylophora pistillata TaxID=50429 RepID=A0A2B4RXF1_STYPI|nr:uncharacterized protein LOC111336267 [Stylophora pistillata]PFX20922.1 Ankyrin-3 [Stylophora pistillata]